MGLANHSLTLKSNGQVWSWGDNSFGQLGDNTIAHKSSPVLVVGSHNFFTLSETIIIEDIVVALFGIDISGTVCWGHVTGVIEDNTRTFTGNITDGADYFITGTGDSEKVYLFSGGYVELETFNFGARDCRIKKDAYQTGFGTVIIKYKNGDTLENCEADTWTTYTGWFTCSGYVKVRAEVT